ncbi:MAG: hypothetical protein GTN89_07755 [Acidobacteria bacterium]|nr:hypothetical protein [Acidobacteriota bacterium]NIM64227.1 hypothetical protein [Acidobacteriota bacterium]NIO59225.1 hypothetical protein [Acidobacteriota bacterium]NIQ30252.1 hypothetical protein [Acidobacteriota bacterium]NIQ85180.1 hypothetical protein [Acidobacteriota bacterium]
MAWLKRVWRALVRAVRWLLRNTRNRLSPRGQLVFDWIAGLLLIALGAITGPVPFVQGWVFGLAGLAILSNHSRTARRLFERIKWAGRQARERYRERSDREQ